MTDHRSRARILDVREERKAASRFEFREDQATGEIILTGYAATFTPYDAFGGPERGGWVETLSRNAFDQTLRSDPDVQLLLNHEGLPLARTKSGTLKLGVDQHGLRIQASLDPSDPDVQGLVPKMRRGDIDEMSFAFRVKDQVWDDNYTARTITEVSLHKGDVSVVNYGMNPGTRAVLEQGVEAMASLSQKELVELRRLDPDLVHRASVALATVIPPGEIPGLDPSKISAGTISKRAWRANDEHSDLEDGQCPECSADGEGQSATHFADPGHLSMNRQQVGDEKGVRRFPIDAKHVVATWRALQKDQRGYTSSQLANIRKRAAEAMRKAGHPIDDPQRKAGQDAAQSFMSGVSHVDMVRNVDGGTTLVAVLFDGTRTPLPSSPATNISSPAPGDARLGGMFPTVWAPPGVRTAAERDSEAQSEDEEKSDDYNDPYGDIEDQRQGEDGFGGKKANPFEPGDKKRDEIVPSGEGRASGAGDDEPDSDEDDPELLSFGAGPINVTRALSEFRSKSGLPEIRSVSDGLAYLKRA